MITTVVQGSHQLQIADVEKIRYFSLEIPFLMISRKFCNLLVIRTISGKNTIMQVILKLQNLVFPAYIGLALGLLPSRHLPAQS